MKAVHGIDELGPDRPMLVWVLVPCPENSEPALDYYSDYSQSRDEFERAFAALSIAWEWLPVTASSIQDAVDAVVRSADTHSPVAFNLCDGDEVNGTPGIAVVRALEAAGLAYTGADASFYHVTTSKIDMKHAFDAAGVSTSPWEEVRAGDGYDPLVFERIGRPLIVKPAVSAGSMGITVHSVVESDASLRAQLLALEEGYKGWNLTSGGVLVERFIAGPEFTTFIVGPAHDMARCRVYPSVERVFHQGLPASEQFLSYDRLWEVYEREAAIGDGEYLWQYRIAPAELQERLGSLSLEAYRAVAGRGYGRVDLRMDAATGELFVLEVNAQCGLSEDEDYTSIGAILRVAGVSFRELVMQIINDALLAAAQAIPEVVS